MFAVQIVIPFFRVYVCDTGMLRYEIDTLSIAWIERAWVSEWEQRFPVAMNVAYQ